MADKVYVETQCSDCGGSGLYQGFAEPKDTAVVCLGCDGSGCKVIEYIPFTGRKRKNNPNIRYVQRSRGSVLVTGVGPTGNKITIDQFYQLPIT